MKDRIKFFCFPLFLPRGLFLLAFGALIPIFVFLIGLEIKFLYILECVFLIFFCSLIVFDLIQISKKLKTFSFESSLPKNVFSGVEGFILLSPKFQSSVSQELLLQFKPNSINSLDFIDKEQQCILSSKSIPKDFSFKFFPKAKGYKSLDSVVCRVSNLSRLFNWQFDYIFSQPLKIKINPNDGRVESKDLPAFLRQMSGQLSFKNSFIQGREFDSLRKYFPGDDTSHIDWKRTAKTGNLLVKVYRPETHQRVSVAIDCGRRMNALISNRLQIEYATDATAHLLRLASQVEDEIGFFAFSHRVQKSIRCRKGSNQEFLIRDSLLDLEVDNLDSDYQLLNQWAKNDRKRSLLVLISSIVNPSGLDNIKKALIQSRRTHLPLVFILEDPDLITLCQKDAESLEDAYIISAANEQNNKIKRSIETLNQLGIHSIYCSSSALGYLIQEKYREIKERGVL